MFSKNTAAKIVLFVIVGSTMALPLVASAAWTTPNIWGVPPGFWGPLISCSGNYTNLQGMDPCVSLCDLIDTAINIIYFGMTLALFVIAPVVVVVGGIMIMMGGANPGMLETGKKALTGVVVGILLVLGAYLIVNTTITVLNLANVGGFGKNTCSTTS